MKRFTSVLIGCSLALVGAAMAQQPEDQQQTGGKKKQHEAAEQATTGTHAGAKAGAGANARGEKKEMGAGANARGEKKEMGAGAKNRGAGAEAGEQAGAGNEHKGAKGKKGEKAGETTQPSATGTEGAGANATPGAGASATTGAGATGANAGAANQVEKGKKGRRAERGVNAKGNANANASATPTTGASVAPNDTTTNANTGQTGAAANNQPNRGANVAGRGEKKRVDPQQVQQIKQQHASFRAQPRPDKAPPVTFNQNYRIEGAERWQGPQYEVFRSYHPERHDQGWYRSRYQRVELIGGGYYFWNNGYWYPAWGYDSGHEYYAYDGPIYVGHRAEPPDQVIADVQTELQQMGYYQGEVDGLMGPLTRQALTAYQADQGLTQTAAIDEPTLDSLQLG